MVPLLPKFPLSNVKGFNAVKSLVSSDYISAWHLDQVYLVGGLLSHFLFNVPNHLLQKNRGGSMGWGPLR